MKRYTGSVFIFAFCAILTALTGGCGKASRIAVPGSAAKPAVYSPHPASAAFKALRLEKAGSIVVLKIEGADPHSIMTIIYELLLRKGYAVRDVGETFKILVDNGIFRYGPTDSRMLEEAAGAFTEDIGIAGSVETVQADPLKILLELYWYDLKKRKRIWTMKASSTGAILFGAQKYEAVVRQALRQAMAAVPRAEP